MLQDELDEARIIAEKARSTYDKLKKQRDFQKINHRRVQQEKQKLNADALKNKKKFDDLKSNYDSFQEKINQAVKEKMLMSLEKDRLIAKVNSLQISLNQINEDGGDALSVDQKAASETKRSK